MTQFSVTFNYIKDSSLANTILDKTPVVTKYFKDIILTIIQIKSREVNLYLFSSFNSASYTTCQ